MATKKELEARIIDLEVEVSLLRAEQTIQQPVVIQPKMPYAPYPYIPTWPWPGTTCTATTHTAPSAAAD